MKPFLVLMFAFLLTGSALSQDSVSLPVGTTLKVRLENNLATLTSRTGDSFSARVAQPLELGGKTVVPVGATIEGRVTQIREPRRFEGKPTIGIFPETLIMPNGEHFALNARLVDTSVGHGTTVNEEGQFKGKGYSGKDVAEVAAGTGSGMMIGMLAGGGKGLLIGGAIGASATVGHWLSKKKYASMPAGTELMMELSRPMEMHGAPAGQ